MNAYFVTGTDTDAGKTVIATGLMAAARRRGLAVAGGKPVASGCEPSPQGLRNADALAIQTQCHPALPYEVINPFAFEPAIAPHIAAREAGVALSLSSLKIPMRSLLAHGADFTLIEGAGGWRVPLNDKESLSDLAIELALPVVLVVGVRLGAINHARLTLEAIHRDGVRVAGWVANVVDPELPRRQQNLDSLVEWLSEQGGAPCLGTVPWLEKAPWLQAPSAERVADFLDVEPLLTTTAETENPNPGFIE
ncbi:dethiobiotin synthase [Salinicola corii]|uniref:ATP-dependent dethiobiotin synthetase BioD n=1 Tax=Salinicola corii TaxID=2606937 RepID=A0A640W9S5_9GAMM|nr:dethiobiotin synthase [Salinicola corii]KAA0015780.1 dethiobiotin synthase [Salinicola corii]